MTHEELERAINFIVETLGRLSVNDQKQDTRLDRLIESHEKAEHRLGRDERILRLTIRAGRRERSTRSEADGRLTNALAEIAQSIASEPILKAPINNIRKCYTLS